MTGKIIAAVFAFVMALGSFILTVNREKIPQLVTGIYWVIVSLYWGFNLLTMIGK